MLAVGELSHEDGSWHDADLSCLAPANLRLALSDLDQLPADVGFDAAEFRLLHTICDARLDVIAVVVARPAWEMLIP